ncbi:MAG: type IV pilus secretin PilQ [Gammaproteobacteria bacterium]|nr:type IV pilus secretin PilQ [Gammaproteobacteria bacterium]
MIETTTINMLREKANSHTKRIRQVAFLLIASSVFLMETAFAISLNDISYSALPGDRVQLSMRFSEALQEEPVNFTIDNPARIAIDLPNVSLNVDEKSQSIGIGMAHSVAAVEAADRTRVVVNLVSSTSYDIKLQDNLVLVTLGAGSPVMDESQSRVSSSRNPSGPTTASIENIDFRRGDAGEGRIIVKLSDPSVGVNLGTESGQIVVDFISTNLPSELDRRLDVIDFATPVKEVDTSSYGGGARMLISTVNEQYDHLAYQSEDVFTIEIRPLSDEEQEEVKKKKFGYTGERLSLNFQNIEVRAVLQLIADFTGLNLVASDTVGGNVTLRLKNVPWDQALDIILKAKGLAMRQAGNVMMVGPQEEIAAREKLELESQRQVEELAPLRTEFVQINYAKAADLAGLIQSGENNLLSDRGNVSIDERTNTLIVQDVSTSLEAIRSMVSKLDIPIKQVMIESRIVNADESFTRDLGVQFGYSKHSDQSNQVNGELFAAGGGTVPGFRQFGAPTAFNRGADDLLVSLPVAGATSGIGLAVGKIGSYLLQLELSALLAEGRGEDIASPKVITSNQTEAVIESGVEIPFQEASSSGATSVSFKKAVLGLRVTPQITPDNRVLLDLNVNQDTRGSPDVLGVPPINTRNVQTQVLVDDGETVVLGGVYSQVDRTSSDRVPFFGELPVLGFLFKKNRVENQRTELLIFVTPKIIKEDLKI